MIKKYCKDGEELTAREYTSIRYNSLNSIYGQRLKSGVVNMIVLHPTYDTSELRYFGPSARGF